MGLGHSPGATDAEYGLSAPHALQELASFLSGSGTASSASCREEQEEQKAHIFINNT